MSTTVDSRVLEMRFDNKQFEQGVSTTMSTLDKLKQKLNFTGASKGLEDIGRSAKNVSFAGMNSGIETVQAKFSALQVMGITALTNITNQAVNAGKRMAKALTIEPISTGFQEYESQINAVQTILANTQKEGTNVEIVNKALDELNTYADKTIYNLGEMIRNIGTFTAAGVKLDTSLKAIQGIANLAAVSGSTSQQASTAMYQLSQALSSGTVRLMDWNSVVNAGMGGQVFQDALVETSRLLGTGADQAIAATGSFRESLREEWLTAEVLTKTLKKFTTTGAAEYISEFTGLSKEMVDSTLESTDAWGEEAGAIDKAAEALAKKSGKNKDEIKQVLQFAKTAEDAATKVKTFTQLIDILKEAAQSGWSQTWRIIVGDFEEAKELFTGLSNFFGGIIGKSADNRNKILEGALSNNPFTKLAEKIEKVTTATDKLSSATKKVTDVTKNYNEVVNKIIGGEFGNGEERFKKLTEAGYDWAHAQNLVNEKLGDSTRHATNYKESQEEVSKTQEKVNETQKVTIDDLVKMSDAQLKQIGFTQDEVESFRELEKQSEKTGIPLKDLVKDIDQLNGRTLLLNSFKNIGQSLVKVFTSIGKAWKEAFWGDATEEDIIAKKTESLYNAISAFHKFSTTLKISDDTAKKITSTFKGLFAIIDIIKTITGGGLNLAFKVLSKVLGAFDMDVLDLTATIGNALVAFRDFLFNNKLIDKGFELLADGIVEVINAVKKFYNTFKNLPQVQKFINKIVESIDELKNMDLSEIGQNIIEGLQNGLGDGVSELWNTMKDIGKAIIDSIKSILGIHSPSTVMIAIGGFIIAGLIIGLTQFGPELWTAIEGIGSNVSEKFGEIFGNGSSLYSVIENGITGIGNLITKLTNSLPWNKLFAIGVSVTMAYFTKQIADAISGIANAFDGFGELLEGAGDVLSGFGKKLKGQAWDYKAKALQRLAVSIGILTASIYVLSKIPDKDLGKALGTIISLSAVLIGLAIAVDRMNEASITIGKGVSIDGLKTGLVQIGIAMLLLAATVKLIGNMNPEKAIKGFIGLTAMMIEIAVFIGVIGKITKDSSLEHFDKVGKMMRKIAVSMLLMVAVCKLVGMLSPEEMIQGALFASAFVIFSGLIGVAARIAGPNVDKFGKMAKKMSVAMLLMVGVCKLVGMLSAEEMLQGAVFATAFVLFVGLLGVVTRTMDKELPKLGRLLLSMSISMALMVGVCKLVGMLSPEEMVKGGIFVAAFVVLIKTLVAVTKIGNEQKMTRVSATILSMAVAIGILAAVSIAISLIDVGGLIKGLTVVGILSAFMIGMIKATRGANDVKGNLIVMVVAITVMAGAVAALSLIDGSKLAGATLALSTLMGMFALIAKCSSNIQSSLPSIIIMTVAVGLLAGILYALSMLNIQSTIEIAGSLSLLMLSLSASMLLISKTGPAAMAAMPAALAMTGILALITGIVGALAKFNVGPTLEIAKSLSMLLLSLSAACFIMAGAAAIASVAAAGLVPLTVLIVGMGALMAAIAGLVTWQPKLEQFLGKVLPILKLIGQGIGEFLGGIATGFASSVLDILPKFGMALSAFMDGVQPFISLASTIDSSVLKGVGYLSGAIIALTAANLLSGIGNFLSFGQTFADLGTQLSGFMKNALPFIENVKMVDPASIEAADTLARMIISLTSANLLSSITSFIGGGVNFSDFGTQLTSFGKAVADFSSEVKGKIDPASVEAAANAGLAMSKLAKAIPKSDGFLQDIIGESDLEKFGSMCKAFGTAIKEMSASLVGEGGNVLINDDAINSAVKAGKGMSKIANSIPKSDGFLQDIVGESDLEKFGSMCKAFGTAIKQMSLSLTSEDGISLVNEDAINSAIKAGEGMSKIANAIPKSDGFLQDIVGEQDLSNFGSTCKAFGEAIKEMSSSLGGEDGSGFNVEVINTAITAGKKMSALAKALPEEGLFDGKMNLVEFSSHISGFGTAISGFSSKVSDINAEGIGIAISAANKIKSLINSLVGIDTSGVAVFTGIGTGGIGADGVMSDVAKAIADFCDKTSGIDTGSLDVSVSAAIKLKSLISGLAGLDTSGITNFKVDGIGTAIKGYYDKVSGIDVGVLALSISSANRLRVFINSLSGFDSSGVASFKSALDQLSGINIQGFVDSFNNSSFQLSSVGINMINSIISGLMQGQAKISMIASSIMNTTISEFKSKSTVLVPVGKIMMDGLAVGLLSGKDNCISVITGLSAVLISSVRSKSASLAPVGRAMINGFASGLSSGKGQCITIVSSLTNTISSSVKSKISIFRSNGTAMMNGFAQGLQSGKARCVQTTISLVTDMSNVIRSKQTLFKTNGIYLATGLVSGITSKKSAVKSAVTSLVSGATSGIRSNRTSFYNAGTYLGSGLVSGINSKKTAAYNAGYALGQAGAKGVKDGQKSHSPSKLTIQDGKWLGEGLIIGIKSMMSTVSKAGNNLGSTTAKSISSSIAKVSDMVNLGIDSNPTIRPVVDLSNVKAGVDSIGSMMGINPSIGVLSTVGSINSAMNQRSQNGVNDEVVSAINKLRKDLGSVRGNTYNINGVTYDDGTNVSNAVEELIRAVKIEGRV